MTIRKLLVANRGEIAVRIVKACHELGITAVAVYSDADAAALHVQVADEAVSIGPPPAAASYLNIPAVVQAALAAGTDAVHPGYGFLSENPEFAEACEAAGILFVGPPARSMRAMADKIAAKQTAARLGVPVVPGFNEASEDDEALQSAAIGVGFPLLIKASAGGGGRGMRIVREPAGLTEAIAGARREARAAFGEGRLLLERYLEGGRHIEAQLLADAHGNVAVLGTRECSIQRRYQKVIEEAPAPGLPEATVEVLRYAAVSISREIGYRNAGTLEFMVDPAGNAYFLEMNTRLQVEHGVTELVTGVDLVHQQLAIAEGRPLPPEVLAASVRGHAIECRVYAEDPDSGFLPSPGRVTLLRPPLGGGLRHDLGVAEDGGVSQHYDPLIGKLMVYAADRTEAVRRLDWALANYAVAGPATNLPVLRFIARHPAFVAGRVTTQTLESELLPAFAARAVPGPGMEVPLAAISFELLAVQADDQRGTGPHLNVWYQAGASGLAHSRPPADYQCGEEQWRLRVLTVRPSGTGAELTVEAAGEVHQFRAQLLDPHRLYLQLADHTVTSYVIPAATGLEVLWRGERYLVERQQPRRRGSSDAGAASSGQRTVASPMPATVVKVAVTAGDRVKARQTLLVLESMKMEHTIQAPADGVVASVRCHEGESVTAGAVLIELAAPG